MSLIKKPNEVQKNKIIKALIIGTPDSGKTTLAISSEKPLLVDCEGGITRVKAQFRSDYVECKLFDTFLELLQSKEVSQFKTIVIDPLGEFVEQLKAYIIRKDSKIANDPRKLYPAIVKEFKRVWNLLKEKELSIIFVGHIEEVMKSDSEGYKIQVEGSGVKNFLPTQMDIVGMLKKIDKAGKTERFLSFEQNENFTFGKRFNGLEPILKIEENIGNKNTFFQDVIFKKFCESIDSDADAIDQFNSLIALIDKRISGLETLEQVNEYFVNGYKKLERIWSSDLYEREAIRKRVEVLGFQFDSKINLFKEKEVKNDKVSTDTNAS